MALPRFELPSALERVTGGLMVGELSRWAMVSKGNVTGVAGRLSEAGLSEREPTPTEAPLWWRSSQRVAPYNGKWPGSMKACWRAGKSRRCGGADRGGSERSDQMFALSK